MSHWIRLYTRDLDDPVVQGLSDGDYKFWTNVQLVAGKLDGDIPGSNGRLPNLDDLAFLLRMKEKVVRRRLDELLAFGLLVRDAEALRLRDWAINQRKSDSSNARVREHRERQRQSAQCNVTEPLPEARSARDAAVSPTLYETAAGTPIESEEDGERESSSFIGAVAARDDDDLLRKLKEAAKGHLDPGCANVSPIRALLGEGCELEADILPYFRDRITKLTKPLQNFAAPWLATEIRASAEARKSAPGSDRVAPPGASNTVFVSNDEPRWALLCDRFRAERRSSPPAGARNPAGYGPSGWYFPHQWIADLDWQEQPLEAAE